MNSRIHQLAKAEAYQRVPETCPAVSAAATKHLYAMTKWVDTRFAEKLTDHDRSEIAGQLTVKINDLLESFKELGSVPLRTALITEIENNLRLNLSQERIDRIEAGEEPEDTLKPLADSTTYHHTAAHAITLSHDIQTDKAA